MALVAEISRPPFANALDLLQDLVKADLMDVNQVIIKNMDSRVPLIPELAGHLVKAGGKLLRPMLTLAATRMCGYSGNRHIPLAACIEFIHVATLLHDDVVDDSNLRRGTASARALWGNKSSVLVGDFLFARAFELMVASKSLEVLRILSAASSKIVEGEVLQLLTTNNINTTEADYLEVITAKTAQLFAAGCQIAGVVAESPQSHCNALRDFGRDLGIVFQLIDDVLDYKADVTELGKEIGDDFREGKITLPVLLAYNQGNEEEKAFWHRTLNDLQQSDADLKQAITYIKKHDAITHIFEKAKFYAKSARNSLAIFPDSPYRQALEAVTEYSLNRVS